MENLKKQIRTSNSYIEKIFSEKQILQQNYQTLKIEYDKYKASVQEKQVGNNMNDSSDKGGNVNVNSKKVNFLYIEFRSRLKIQ